MDWRLLSAITSRLDGTASAGAVKDVLVMLARELDFKRCAVLTAASGGGAATLVAGIGLTGEEERSAYPLDGAMFSAVAQGTAAVLPGTGLFAKGRGKRSAGICLQLLPFKRNDEVVGLLAVERKGLDKRPDEDMEFLGVAAALMAPVISDLRARGGRISSMQARPQGFVGNSEVILNVYEQIAHVAQSAATVLLTGESGTGKELAAQAIHMASARAAGPFISLNCAALPENLVESELFGHEKGAFTGAVSMRRGRFELADGGTLFLDEVGELPLMVQAKLLRVLQDHCFERLGSMQSRRADVRIITATNRELEAMVSEGSFRRDLFYRLNVFPIHLPPLRSRQSDILPLAAHFVRAFSAANGKHDVRISLSAGDMLQRYTWPGNVRELANVMERAVLLADDGGLVLPQHLPRALHSERCRASSISAQDVGTGAFGPLQERLDELERACILDALTRFRGHMGHAAEALRLSERVMALRMKKYGISYKEFRRGEA